MVEDGMGFSAWGGASNAPPPLQERHAGGVQSSAPQLEGAVPTQQWWPPSGPAQPPATQPSHAAWPAPGLPPPAWPPAAQPSQGSWNPGQPQAGSVSDRTQAAADPGSAAWGFGGYPAPAASGPAPAMSQLGAGTPAEAHSAAWGGKGGSREQAAWALWYQQWAAQMGQFGWPPHPAMTGYGAPPPAFGAHQPPYSAAQSADGTQQQAAAWPGQFHAGAQWPGWGEAPPWPAQSQGPATATSAPIASVPEGRPESPTSASAAVAAGDATAGEHGNQTQAAGPSTEQPFAEGEVPTGDGEHQAAAPGAAVSAADHELCQDITSAVALFLAGNDDGFDSEDNSDDDDDKTSALPAAPAPEEAPPAQETAPSAAAPPPAAAAAMTTPQEVEPSMAAPPVVELPMQLKPMPSPPPGLTAIITPQPSLGSTVTGPQAGIATPPQASFGAPATLPNGTPPKTSASVGHGRTGQLAGEPAGIGGKAPVVSNPITSGPTQPSAAGVQDFLNVLRRRALPSDITEEKRQQINKALFSCVMSLYRDRIKPVQNHLQRRLRERNVSDSAVMAVLPLCAREPETYRITPPMRGQQPTILFVEEPLWFTSWVDVESPESNFGPDAWEAFHGFLSSENAVLPSQPYQAAVELRQRSLPALQKLCLGELEHMVRQAIGRNLLKHHGDSLKAVKLAKQLEASDKERRSRVLKADMLTGKPPGITSQDIGLPGDITDGDDLTVVLLQLMQRFPNGVALSLMKHYVQSYCKRNLNEAHFKCSKLAEVFKLAPLNQIFPLETRSRSEIIVKPPKPNAIPVHIWQKFYHLREVPTGGAPPPDAASEAAISGIANGPTKKAPPPPPPPPPPSMTSTSDGSVAAKGMRLQ
mmetsp:Transcript_98990/g.181177  ORF Transcript_98990/g.181177 Transcript_98990/m.181177 type:complete len:868 (+) Transcript_98990:121-2724(+)